MKDRQKSRSGCLTCEQKRLRCDMIKPNCDNCTKKGLRCPGYQPRLKWSTKYEMRAVTSGPDNFVQLVTAASEAIDEGTIQDARIPISQAAVPPNSNPESQDSNGFDTDRMKNAASQSQLTCNNHARRLSANIKIPQQYSLIQSRCQSPDPSRDTVPLAPPGMSSVEVDSACSDIPESPTATNANGDIYQYDLCNEQKKFIRVDALTRHHGTCHPDIQSVGQQRPTDKQPQTATLTNPVNFSQPASVVCERNDGNHLKVFRQPPTLHSGIDTRSFPIKGSDISPAVLDNLLERSCSRRLSSTATDKQRGQKRGQKRRLSEGQTTMVLRRSKRTLAPKVARTCENRDGADGKCDYEDPYKQCSEKALERGYKSVNPQAQLDRIEDGMKYIKEVLTTLGGEMEMLRAEGRGASKSEVGSGRNHSHPHCPSPSPPPPGPPQPEDYAEYLADFQEHMLPLCPLLTPDELQPNKFRSLLDSDQPAEKAVALLVCALGCQCRGKLATGGFVDLRGNGE
ncbi:hypothetical protein B0T26DRAFT_670966 [Lasiosphaeria miniovina]|uniref:Zn(2)-C6 fungal-type domain-containing protein n=1 Tax=Lasiosphaeria miniovina TaxID=1954250 RepID=A0AA40BI92_9PEZI|nr:uncharacterized protein B0T26DRAFT_670966 [Lasiosphaeria miniovina]KAK0734710.1 hypothetical protein B0T26DRAFT_670966 [Lasiosphaeria miniovina]